MNQSVGSEVAATLAPRCYEKIANVLSAQTCLQRAGAMMPVRSNPVRCCCRNIEELAYCRRRPEAAGVGVNVPHGGET